MSGNGNKEEEVFLDTELLKNSGKEMNNYRTSGKFCDFELRLGSTGTIIKVHKDVLSSSCSYFRALFDSNMIECEKGYLEFNNVISDIQLESIVEYLYTGQISVSFSEAEAFYEHAIYFDLEDLAKFCTEILIKNITFDNCLYLWRLGVKLRIESLKSNAFKFILQNADVLFDDESFLNLATEEMEILISDDKIASSEEKIFLFVIKWLNHDLENRKNFFKNLLEDIRYTQLTDKFIKNEILTNEFLLENKTIPIITLKILEAKLDIADISCLKFNKSSSARVGFCKKNLVFILDKSIFHYNLKEGTTSVTKSIQHSPAKITTFSKNFLLLAGGENSKNCSYYCPVRQFVKPFPAMNENRKHHGIVTLNDKIYCCGGLYNNTSVEVFDVGAGIWNKGINLNSGRFDFGITTWENNCIYAIGGSLTNCIGEKYDQREDKWSFLPQLPLNADTSFMKSCVFNNTLYAFSKTTGYIFDIRANKWMEETIARPPASWSTFDITNVGKKVYVIGKNGNRSHVSYTYDIIKNSWLNTLNLQPFESVSLTTMFT